MYINGLTLYVWLTDQGQSLDEAVVAIRSSFRKGKFDHLTPVALRAKYGFLQLDAWHDQIEGVLSIDGAIYTDIDDRNNRLTVGVEDVATQGPAVEAELKRVGVPLAAVDIIQEEPFLQAPGPGASPLDPAAASAPQASRERAAGSSNSKDSRMWVAPGLALAFIGLIVFVAMRSRRRSQDEPSSSVAAVGR